MDVTLADGSTVTCDDEPFARGADGAAYWSRDGRALVKLYHNPEPWRPETLTKILGDFNAVRGDPYWEELLCWPIGIVKQPGLGVVIPRAPTGMVPIGKLLLPRWLKHHPEHVGTFSSRLGIALRLARAVRRLHFKGLCHSDLSDNNVFADPRDGRAYVIDCDGLVVPGKARPVVIGTPGLIAPELWTGAVREPSVATDCHALAVLIYRTLLLRHPLEGRKVHDANNPTRDDYFKYGEKALYIEHPTDASNRPTTLPWPATLLGLALTRLVQRAFIEGLHQPARRPSPAEWERDLVRLADTIVGCPNPDCTLKTFPLPDPASSSGGVVCPWCGTRLRGFTIPVLQWQNPVPGQAGVFRADGTYLVAYPNNTLHAWHVEANRLPGPTVDKRPVARFHFDPASRRWFVVNLQLPLFEVADPSQAWKRARPNEGVELRHDRRLRFGAIGSGRDAVVSMLRLT